MGYALAIRGVVQVGSGRIQDGRWNASRKKAGYKRSSADHLSTSISYLIRGSKFRSNSRYHSARQVKMANGVRRSRGTIWSHEETLLLVELKKEAHLNNEGGAHVWNQISDEISRTFTQARSCHQCQRRWDTLKKLYNRIEEHCAKTGEDYRNLDKELLDSMKLPTAYREDWYTIAKEVFIERGKNQLQRKKAAEDAIGHPAPIPDIKTPPGVAAAAAAAAAAPPTITTTKNDKLPATPWAPNGGHPVTTILNIQHEETKSANSTSAKPGVSVVKPKVEVQSRSLESEVEKLSRERDELLLRVHHFEQQQQNPQQEQVTPTLTTQHEETASSTSTRPGGSRIKPKNRSQVERLNKEKEELLLRLKHLEEQQQNAQRIQVNPEASSSEPQVHDSRHGWFYMIFPTPDHMDDKLRNLKLK